VSREATVAGTKRASTEPNHSGEAEISIPPDLSYEFSLENHSPPDKASAMTQPCSHNRVQVISQDENGKFVECLDCREIYEAAELDELTAPPQQPDTAEASSLADA
jgi:hypothetical protein